MKHKNINEVLNHYRPNFNEVAARLNNDYIVPPSAIQDSHNYYEDDGNYYVQRQGVIFIMQELFGTALSIKDNGCAASFSSSFAQGISAILRGQDSDGMPVEIRRDGIGMSEGEPAKSYAGSQTVAEKRLITTFGNAGGLFLSRANRDKEGKFSLDRYKTEFEGARQRQDKPQPLHPDGINLNIFDILNFPGQYKMNPLEAESETKEDGFTTRFFSRPTIIEMLNRYFGHLAWSYIINGLEFGIRGDRHYAAVSATLVLWPNANQPTTFTEKGYAEGTSAQQALYGADVAALKRAFSRIGATGGIQFWSNVFNLNDYTYRFNKALTEQRQNPQAERLINEDILLPPPPGWEIPVPQDGSEVNPGKAYSVDSDGFLPDVAQSQSVRTGNVASAGGALYGAR